MLSLWCSFFQGAKRNLDRRLETLSALWAGGLGGRAGFIFPERVPIISLPFRSKAQAGKERLGEQKGGRY